MDELKNNGIDDNAGKKEGEFTIVGEVADEKALEDTMNLVMAGTDVNLKESKVKKDKPAKKEKKAKKVGNKKNYIKAVSAILICSLLILALGSAIKGIHLYSKMDKSAKKLITAYNNQPYTYEQLETQIFNADGTLTEDGLSLFNGKDYREFVIGSISGDNMDMNKYISFYDYYNRQLATDREGVLDLFEQLPEATGNEEFVPNSEIIAGAFEMLSVGGAEYLYYVSQQYISDIITIEYLRASLGAMDDYLAGLNTVYSEAASGIDTSDQDEYVINMSDIIDSVVVDKELKKQMLAESKKINTAVILNIAFNSMLESGKATVQSTNSNSESTESVQNVELDLTDLQYCFSLDKVKYDGTIELWANAGEEVEAAVNEMTVANYKLVEYLDNFGIGNWKLFNDKKKSDMLMNSMTKYADKAGRADKVTYENIMEHKLFSQNFKGAGIVSAILGESLFNSSEGDKTIGLAEGRLGIGFEFKASGFEMDKSLEDGFNKYYDYVEGCIGFLTSLNSSSEAYVNSIVGADGNIDMTKINKNDVDYKKAMLYCAITESLYNRYNITGTY